MADDKALFAAADKDNNGYLDQKEYLSFTHPDFNSLRRAAFQINANKIALDTLGAKTAVVMRDPQYADTYRELDKITIHIAPSVANATKYAAAHVHSD